MIFKTAFDPPEDKGREEYFLDSGMKKVKTLELMAEHEKAINQLYQEYARKFPKNKDFWSKIASEEIDHTK